MIANSLTLSRTIDTDQGAKEHYVFPKYQREYSWGKKDWDAILGSARNEVRGRPRSTNELYLMDAVIEPEGLAQISLGQENPRMRMNAAPGSRAIRRRTRKGFHNAVLCSPFRARRIAVNKTWGVAPG